MSSGMIGSILERIVSKDKDHRYMAVSDLQGELQKPDFRVDEGTERRLCKVVLQQLEDSSGDVSGLAVKCLGLLACRLQEVNVEGLLQDLCTKLFTAKKEHQRDLASIGLKTVVAEVSGGQLAKIVVKRVAPHLIAGIKSQDSPDVVSMSLDITNDLLTKFGNQMNEELTSIAESVMPELDSARGSLRKRAIHCLGSLAPYLQDELLDRLVEHLLSRLQSQELDADAAQTYMHCLGAVSRAVAWRFGKYLDQAVPLAVKYCQNAAEGEDELQEYCLQALESFMLRCPHVAKGHFPAIFPIALSSLRYDPNYTEGMEEDQSEPEEEDELTDEDYSDDEDASWKVRRAAAKLVAAVIVSQPELLPTIYPQAAPALVQRFREREENVKTDVFSAFVDLVHMVGTHAGRSDEGSAASAQLQGDADGILKAAARQLREKSPKTRSGIFLALRELVLVLPGAVTAESMVQLLPAIVQALTDKSTGSAALKIQALQFLLLAIPAGGAAAWQAHLPQLLPPLLAAVRERYYKVAAEGLRVCTHAVSVLRPSAPSPVPPPLEALVPPLLAGVKERLSALDQDQEVKEAAITCAGACLASLGDIAPDVPLLLQMLVDRLRNEITRLAAVKAIDAIASSPLPLPLAPVLPTVLTELTGFLRKANRPLRQASLSAIDALVTSHGAQVPQQLLQGVVGEVVALISEVDLVVAAMGLRLITSLVTRQPATAPTVHARVLPPSMALLQSQLLQGAALEALKAFLVTLLGLEGEAAGFDPLLGALLAAGTAPTVGKAAQHATAQCIAGLCLAAGYQRTMQTVSGLMGQLQSTARDSEAAQRLALLAVGEVGRTADLSAFPPLKDALTSALSSSSEEIKGAASLALGAVCIGNLAAYLPFLLQAIRDQAENPKDQYLLLKALNEALVSLAALPPGGVQLAPQDQGKVLNLLLECCEAEEECAHVVSECLGHLALLSPEAVLPSLQECTATDSVARRAVIVYAVKFMVVDKPHPIDAKLHAAMPGFLSHLSDSDWHVRKAGVQTLSAAAHNKAALVADQLEGALPQLYAQTRVDEALVRTVDLGPFKHKVDDGLELRKAAFEAMDVLLDACRPRLALPAFLQPLGTGLKDHYDVKMPCHLLLAKLAAVAPAHVLAALDGLVEPLNATLNARVKSDAVKQEIDRNEDMVRSCLRAVEAIARIPNAETSVSFNRFMNNTVLSGQLAKTYSTIKQERAEADGLDASAARW